MTFFNISINNGVLAGPIFARNASDALGTGYDVKS